MDLRSQKGKTMQCQEFLATPCKELFIVPSYAEPRSSRFHPVTYLKETQTISTQSSPPPGWHRIPMIAHDYRSVRG